MDTKKIIEEILQQNIQTHKAMLADKNTISNINRCAMMITEAIKNNHKIIICGNGGSASDAQHMAAEFIGRFERERKALPAVALNTDTSILTAVANDYGYDSIYARQIDGLGEKGDVFIGISTSGNSNNIFNAIEAAKSLDIKTIALSGKNGGKIKKNADLSLVVPEHVTARIQEAHITIIHIICKIVEESIFTV